MCPTSSCPLPQPQCGVSDRYEESIINYAQDPLYRNSYIAALNDIHRDATIFETTSYSLNVGLFQKKVFAQLSRDVATG